MDYSPNGEVAKQIAAVIPYYPFKGVDRFYDIGGFLNQPEIFQLVIDAFVARVSALEIDCIAGIDARGFILGPPIALALKKPFFMIRKEGKLPHSVSGSSYDKEYASHTADSTLCIPKTAVLKGSKVLLIDDLVATGGTLCAAIDLIKQFEGTIVECACVVEIAVLNARAKLDSQGHSDVPVWALISEDLLQLDGLANTAGI